MSEENAPARRGPKNKNLQAESSLDITGWVKPAVGVEIEGTLLGWIPRKGVEQKNQDGTKWAPMIPNIIVKLSEGQVDAKQKKTAEYPKGVPVVCGPGDVIALPVNGSCKKLLGYSAAKPEVYLYCKGTKDVGMPSDMYEWEWAVPKDTPFSLKLPPPIGGGKLNFDYGMGTIYKEDVDDGHEVDESAIPF